MRTPRPLLQAAVVSISLLALSSTTANAEESYGEAPHEGPGWQLFASSYPTNIQPSAVDEIQELDANPAEPSFTATFEGEATSSIPVGSSPAAVQAALEALPKIGAGNITVAEGAGGPNSYTITFEKVLGDVEVPTLTATGATASVVRHGAASGTIAVEVFNVGARESNTQEGGSGPIIVTDTLPPGVTAKKAGEFIQPGREEEGEHGFGTDPEIESGVWDCTGNGGGPPPGVEGANVVTCTSDPVGLITFQGGGGLPTFLPTTNSDNNPQPVVGIAVEANTPAAGLTNHASIEGGGAPGPAATTNPVTVSAEPAKGGLVHADAWFSNPDGTIDTQAGSHPYTATFAFDVATAVNANANDEFYMPGSGPRNLETDVPPGLIGDLHTFPQCDRQRLLVQACPPASMLGILRASTPIFGSVQKQVFNMVPEPGAAAELGFEYANTPAYIKFYVRTGADNSIVSRAVLPNREVDQTLLTLWGVPNEESHNRWRYREGGCSQEEMEKAENGELIDYCTVQQNRPQQPFLTLPTACSPPQPAVTFRQTGLWTEPAATNSITVPLHNAVGEESGFTGCETLEFAPPLTDSLDTSAADSPSGLTVDLTPPLGGLEDHLGLSTADVKGASVALPAGLVINPGQAAGLQACPAGKPGLGRYGDALTTEAERSNGEEDDGPASCPPAAKVGTVTIDTPLLGGDPEKQVTGNVYVLPSQPPDIRLLIAASADGVNLKEVLQTKLNETTGQVTGVASGIAQQPFSDFHLHFEGGSKATLATPTRCSTYTTNADLTPWSSPQAPDFLTNASFAIAEGPGGAACPSGALPFSPSLTAGTTTTEAGGFTPFVMHLTRPDGQQRIDTVSFKSPQGISAIIAGVPQCGETEANAGTCPAGSKLGHAVVEAGPGNNPLTLPQPGEPEIPIYLTGPYRGAPFGLSIVTPAIAGPFNLGTIVTRARIEVDPATGQITVVTDPLPQIIKGVPTDIRSIEAIIDRPGFMFNPTNCTPQTFTGSAQGTAPVGAAGEPAQTAALSSPFDVGGCRGLEFHPRFSVSTAGKASKANGASLDVNVAANGGPQPGGGEANIRSVKVALPTQLPSRLTTLQKACLAAVFEANPASCPKESNVGTATARTPILAQPLMGPAYLVSHGGAAFPDLEIVLQGEGVKLVLDGNTDIKKGITTSTFNTVPDAPISSFELNLPTGPFSVLGAYVAGRDHYNFCGQNLTLPTTITAQNGLVVTQATKLGVTGCPPSVAIVKTAVKGNSVAVTVKLGQQGTVKITGRGLRPTTRRGLKAGTRTITVPLTAVGRAAKRHGRKLKVQAALTVSGRTGTATTTLRA